MYRTLGVRWWGEGTFFREEKRGREIKASALYAITPGSIIYNRLFAFRGSFAIVPEDQAGCYVSNEFPTYVLKPGIDGGANLLRYIVHCLNSPKYLHIVDAQSTGSTKTSRNRFNQKQFVELEIYVPNSLTELDRVVELLNNADELRRQQAKLIALTASLRHGVMGMLPGPASVVDVPKVPTEGEEIGHEEAPEKKPAARRRKKTE